MIKVYETGQAFMDEHRALLDTSPYQTAFFAIDAAQIPVCGRESYGLCAGESGHWLLAMRLAPYSVLLFGDPSAAEELLSFLVLEGYGMPSFLCSEAIGEAVCACLGSRFGIRCTETLGMDFLTASTVTAPSDPAVEIPTEADTEELCGCLRRFMEDCGLHDPVEADLVRRRISEYRVLRWDGQIVSMARIAPDTSSSRKLSEVYTRPAYRGLGCARRVVNTAKNEILAAGFTAVLNVDRKNPISYGLYLSLGFEKLFSQGEYRTE